MVKILFVAAVLFLGAAARAATPDTATNAFEEAAVPVPESELDKLVFAKLSQLRVQPVLCSDAVFVRRAYLDLLGTMVNQGALALAHAPDVGPADRLATEAEPDRGRDRE